jgi:hypothetical protein
LGGFLVIISTSLSCSASTRVATWQEFSLLFLLGFFCGLAEVGPIIYVALLFGGGVSSMFSHGSRTADISYSTL